MRCSILVVGCVAFVAGCSSTPPAASAGSEAPEGAPVPAEAAPDAAPDAARSVSTPTHPALREELLAMMERDQRAREALIELQRGGAPAPTTESMAIVLNVRQVDASNMVRMKEIIREEGWPTITMVGEDGAHAAWIIAQHADTDPDFQAEVLAMLESAVAAGEASKADYALLVDRVRLARGEAQVYATQFEQNEAGEWVPRPTEDLEHVDERRAAMGLPPLEEYRTLIEAMYGGGGQ